jgi:hypothetical protein
MEDLLEDIEEAANHTLDEQIELVREHCLLLEKYNEGPGNPLKNDFILHG